VSAFTSARIDRIVALEPDLVLGFSDLQADIAADLVRAGIAVHVFNHRSVAGILAMIRTLGALVGRQTAAAEYADSLARRLAGIETRAGDAGRRPRVYFEEWDEPRISCIRWVSELIRVAGGDDCFPELALEPLGKNRIIGDDRDIIARRPDIIVGSWCGKKFRPERVAARPGWSGLPAVRDGQVYEIKSARILQPGPAALTDGLDDLVDIIRRWQDRSGGRAPRDT